MIRESFDSSTVFDPAIKDLIKRVLTETAEDLEILVDILKKENVTVKEKKPCMIHLKTYNVGGFEVEYPNSIITAKRILLIPMAIRCLKFIQKIEQGITKIGEQEIF